MDAQNDPATVEIEQEPRIPGYPENLMAVLRAKSFNLLLFLGAFFSLLLGTLALEYRTLKCTHVGKILILSATAVCLVLLVYTALSNLPSPRRGKPIVRRPMSLFVSMITLPFTACILLSNPYGKPVYQGWTLVFLGCVFASLLGIQYLSLRRDSTFLFTLRSVVLAVFVLEAFAYAKNRMEDPPFSYVIDTRGTGDRSDDDSLGWKMNKDAHALSVKFNPVSGDTLYRVLYASDSQGMRDSGFLRKGLKTASVNLFGCSFTYGTGLHFNETIGYLMEQRDPSVTTRNRGFRGYGPHQILLQIMDMDPADCKGDALYTYIPDHLNRVWGGTVYLKWGSRSPDVYIEDDSIHVLKRDPAWLFLNRLLLESSLAGRWDLKLKSPSSDEYMKRFASIVNKSAEIYLKKNPNSRFFVGIYPFRESSQGSHLESMKWRRHLDPRITVIDVESMCLESSGWMDKKAFFQSDGHPMLSMNRRYADSLMRFMGKGVWNPR